jgi:hypothetical protein
VRPGHEGEDRIVVLRALAAGYKFGYFDKLHVSYRVHASNSSTPSDLHDLQRRKVILDEIVRSRIKLLNELPLTAPERRALRQRISTDLFWLLGYCICWQHGQVDAALDYYRQAMSYWPWSAACWKSYAIARLSQLLKRQQTTIANDDARVTGS